MHQTLSINMQSTLPPDKHVLSCNELTPITLVAVLLCLLCIHVYPTRHSDTSYTIEVCRVIFQTCFFRHFFVNIGYRINGIMCAICHQKSMTDKQSNNASDCLTAWQHHYFTHAKLGTSQLHTKRLKK